MQVAYQYDVCQCQCLEVLTYMHSQKYPPCLERSQKALTPLYWYSLASTEVEAEDDEDDDDDYDDCKKSMDEVSGHIGYMYSKPDDIAADMFVVWILYRAQQDLRLSLLRKCPR